MNIFSKIVSWIFLPIFMPVLALVIAMYIPSFQGFGFSENKNLYALYPYNKALILSIFGIFTAVFPAISLLIMRFSGVISTIEVDDRKERGMPIIVMFFYSAFLYYFVYSKFGEFSDTIPSFIYALPLTGVFVMIAFFLLNRWKKISMHAGGVGIMLGFLLAYFSYQEEYQFWIIPTVFCICGLVMTARIYLKKHDLTEVTVGWFLSMSISFLTNYFY